MLSIKSLKSKLWPEFLIVSLLILTATGLGFSYLINPIDHFDADEAIVGLMARHILNGHIPVYFYGQGYMGSLESMLAAGYFAVFGSSVFTLKLAPLTFYILFLILQYSLIRKFGNIALALITLAITVCFTNTMILWSIKARGGFTATLFWGTLAYGIFFPLMDGFFQRGKRLGRRGLLLGATIGIGFWNCSLVFFYLLPILLYFFIFGLDEIIKSRKNKIPILSREYLQAGRWRLYLRSGLKFILLLIGIYLIFGLITAIQGEIRISCLGLDIRSHHGGRDILRGLSALTLVTVVLIAERTYGKNPIKFSQQFISRYPINSILIITMITFLLITAGINIYFQQLPEYSFGHYQPHSPIKDVHQIGDNISLLFSRLLPTVIGVSFSSFKMDLGRPGLIKYSSIFNGLSLTAAILFIIISLICNFKNRINLPVFIRNNRIRIFFFVSFLGCLSASAVSSQVKDTTAYRYLIPVISWLPFFLASLCLFCWKKYKPLGLLLIFLVIGGHAIRLSPSLPYPRATTPEPVLPCIISALKKDNISRAFADYWLAYPITFLSGEKIIVAPYHSHDRYPIYTRKVYNSPEIAYIFKGYKQIIGHLQEKSLRADKIPFRKIRYRWGYLLVTDSEHAGKNR